MKQQIVRIDWYLWTRTDTASDPHFIFEAQGIAATLHVPKTMPPASWLGQRVALTRVGSTFTVLAESRGKARKFTDIIAK